MRRFNSLYQRCDASSYLLVLPGRIRPATDHQRGQHLSVAAANNACKTVDGKLHFARKSYTCAGGYRPSLHARDQSNLVEFYPSNYLPSAKFNVINTRRRAIGPYRCCLSSAYSDYNFVRPRKFSNLSLLESQNPPLKYSTVTRTTADFASEEYDITGTNLDSITSSDGASEDFLAKEVVQAVPWWKQLPKRWVMVLLCFTAFLLCNMDRVRFVLYSVFW